jgi:hypothetical protein
MKTTSLPIYQLLLLVPLLLFSCAHQISPGGGPEDKTGPTILAAAPASGAVNVGRKSRISLSFSEWITKPSALKSISILPPVAGGSRTIINGRRLEIIPASPLAEATTYHVVVTSQLLDLHNNQLSAPFTLVFSTGPALDSGKVTGCVVDAGKRSVHPTVALISAPSGQTDTLFLGSPSYLSQGDSAGYFSIENVRPGAYQLIAFADRNNNRRLDPGVEDAFAPLRPVIMVSKLPETALLYPAESDTATPRLKSVKPGSSREVMAVFTRTLDSLHGCSGPAWSIIRSDKKGDGVTVSQTVWLDNNTRCALLLSDTLSRAQYRCIATYRKKRQTASTVISDTILFNGTSGLDTVRPALKSWSPAGRTALLPEIRLIFTKATMLPGALFLIDSLRDSVRLNTPPRPADTVVLVPARRLHPGSRYRLTLLETSGKDLAGNMLKRRDTTDTVARLVFTPPDADSIAVSLKGCAPCLPPEKNRRWQFIPFSGSEAPLVCADVNNCFTFDSIPSGKGFVAYFTDDNNNGRPDKGVLSPFTPPEPYVVLPDTIEARARWEIEVTDLTPCDRCAPHTIAAPAGKK